MLFNEPLLIQTTVGNLFWYSLPEVRRQIAIMQAGDATPVTLATFVAHIDQATAYATAVGGLNALLPDVVGGLVARHSLSLAFGSTGTAAATAIAQLASFVAAKEANRSILTEDFRVVTDTTLRSELTDYRNTLGAPAQAQADKLLATYQVRRVRITPPGYDDITEDPTLPGALGALDTAIAQLGVAA